MGTSPFALPSLERLHQGNFHLEGVITRPDSYAGRGKKLIISPVKEKALQYGLNLYQPQGPEQLLEVLRTLNFQVLINVAYGLFLPGTILQLPPLGCVNLHPSLLPAYRGAAPIQRALLAGEETTGVTVMYMSPRLDAGDIILQEKVDIGPEENYGSLHDRLAKTGGALLEKALTLIAGGRAPRRPQDEERTTYAPPLSREDEIISWPDPARKIFNQIRALDPAPGAYTIYQGKRLKIWKAAAGEVKSLNLKENQGPITPGTILSVNDDTFQVATGQGALTVLELQLAGKKRMPVSEFLRGNKLKAGEGFG